MVRRQAERAQKVAKKAAQKVVEGARNVDLSKICQKSTRAILI